MYKNFEETKKAAIEVINRIYNGEKMIGCKFEEMSKEQRVLAAICLAAFDGVWNRG